MEYTNKEDLHPLKYKNYINSRKLDRNSAAIKIQKLWRKYIIKKNTTIKQATIKQNTKWTRDRIPSWFLFI